MDSSNTDPAHSAPPDDPLPDLVPDRIADHLAPRSRWYRHPLKVWPYTRSSIGWFLAAYVAMVGLWSAMGFAVTGWLEPSALGDRELELNRWFEERRTPTLDTWANIGSIPSDTPVTIAIMAALLLALPLAYRRWHDWAFLLGALVLEVAVYVTANFIVGRPRPPVDRLEEVATNSFPSGHVGAAVTIYVGALIIASWHTEKRFVLAGAVALGSLVPLIVAISRLYLGVHYLSDVIAGAILGLAVLAASMAIARRGLAEEVSTSPETEPPHTAALDVSDEPSAR